MKKIIAIVLALIMMSISLAACGEKSKTETEKELQTSEYKEGSAEYEEAMKKAEPAENTDPTESTDPAEDTISIDLTLDNWADYFEPVISYGVQLDDANTPESVYSIVSLVPKENVNVISVNNGLADFTWSYSEWAVIRFDAESREFSIDPMTEEERESYLITINIYGQAETIGTFEDHEDYHAGYVKPNYYLGDHYDGWCCNIDVLRYYVETEDPMQKALVFTSIEFNMKEIGGTLIYTGK